MKMLSQVWMVFMLANMVPNGHVSDLNIPRCHLLYFLLRDDYFVDVAKIIFMKFINFLLAQIIRRERVLWASLLLLVPFVQNMVWSLIHL